MRPFLPLDLAAEGRDVGGVVFEDARREGGGGVANWVGVEDLPLRRRWGAAGEEYVLPIGLEGLSSGDEGAAVVRIVEISKQFQTEIREREKEIERERESVPSLVLPGEESEAMADRRVERDEWEVSALF